MDKMFMTKTSFYVTKDTTGKVQFLFLRSFWVALKRKLFCQEYWTLASIFSKFFDFPNFS